MFSSDFESNNGHMFYVDTSVVGMLYQKLRVYYVQLLVNEKRKPV
jgi:hypothetical protein